MERIERRGSATGGAVNKAVHEAVSAIYFDDGSDYLRALWAIVRLLSPETAKLLQQDKREAWNSTYELAHQAQPDCDVQQVMARCEAFLSSLGAVNPEAATLAAMCRQVLGHSGTNTDTRGGS